MIVRPVTVVTSTPTIGMLLGSSGSREMINRINSKWSPSGVVFGSDDNPFADRFKEFNRVFVNTARNTAKLLESTRDFILGQDKPIWVREDEDLGLIPSCMHIPILTEPNIRKKFEEGTMYGWGLDKEVLPEGDPYGRMINNGLIMSDPVTGEWPESYDWEWQSTDPDYSMEELEQLAQSRHYVDTFMLKQEEECEYDDPTDYLDGGKLKRK